MLVLATKKIIHLYQHLSSRKEFFTEYQQREKITRLALMKYQSSSPATSAYMGDENGSLR